MLSAFIILTPVTQVPKLNPHRSGRVHSTAQARKVGMALRGDLVGGTFIKLTTME